MYPSVDRINALPIPRTTKFNYTIVSDNYFNGRQKRALQTAIEKALPGRSVRLQVNDQLVPYEYLTSVIVNPADNRTEELESFEIIVTLQELLSPRRPHTGMGYWLLRAPVPIGKYALGLKILGETRTDTIKKLGASITAFTSVEQVIESPPGNTFAHFLLVIDGDPRDPAEDKFRRELRELGVSLMVSPSDHTMKWRWQ